MKKTEKIEIRVSPEEKEHLSKHAEAEGLPVSEVVRRRLTSDALPQSEQPEAQGVLRRFGAWSLSFIAGASFVLALSAASPKGQEIEGWDGHFRFVDVDRETGQAFPTTSDFRLLTADASKVEMRLNRQDGGYLRATAETHRTTDDQVELTFNVCFEVQDGCEDIASPRVMTYPMKKLDLSVPLANGNKVSFHLRPIDDEQ